MGWSVTLDDPDSNPEHIGWAEFAGAPDVSWANPLDGDQVSGTVSIEIDASDGEDADDELIVEGGVDDGTWKAASWDSGCECYTCSWDSSGVSDGEHILDARAADSDARRPE